MTCELSITPISSVVVDLGVRSYFFRIVRRSKSLGHPVLRHHAGDDGCDSNSDTPGDPNHKIEECVYRCLIWDMSASVMSIVLVGCKLLADWPWAATESNSDTTRQFSAIPTANPNKIMIGADENISGTTGQSVSVIQKDCESHSIPQTREEDTR